MPPSTRSPILLHIPHSSKEIPVDVRRGIVLDDEDLRRELLVMTDHFTDELFSHPSAHRLVYPVSRLVADPERFRRDQDEPMAKRGMGAVYTRTHDGRRLREADGREALLYPWYELHHAELEAWTTLSLRANNRALIIDCHSFPSSPLPCDLDQSPNGPDFCIGTDATHTDPHLSYTLLTTLEKGGLRVTVDRPYSGTIVPAVYHNCDPRVQSVMIEINRKLYMDESTGEKLPYFEYWAEWARGTMNLAVESWVQLER